MQRRDDIDVNFSWRRHRLFDRASVVVLFERCLRARLARVSKLLKKPTSKWRPLPLTTVELQKLGSMFLRMDSQKVMKASLYSITILTVVNEYSDCRRSIHQRMDQLSADRNRQLRQRY